MNADFLVHFNRTLCISAPASLATPSYIKSLVSARENIPSSLLSLSVHGVTQTTELLPPNTLIRARISRGLLGGKGGFGAMLRIMGKGSGAKATTDFGACRDLNGRRLRHVNQEIAMQKWREEESLREEHKRLGITEEEILEVDTPCGIPGWYLTTPSWAEGVRKPLYKRRRKTMLCRNWAQAREKDKVPEDAPSWWGCPRGRQCDFAHGEEELRGMQLTKAKRERKEKELREKRLEIEKYIEIEQENVADAVQSGLKRRQSGNKAGQLTNCKPIAEQELDVAFLESVEDTVQITFWRGIAELRGQANFGTAVMRDGFVHDGRWYFELKLITCGVIQVGWVAKSFSASSKNGEGVGDCKYSWALDGARKLKWSNGVEEEYGEQWEAGDIIGCILDASQGILSFSKNGRSLGVAFHNVCINSNGVCPAISMEENEIVLMNIGEQPLSHLPPEYTPIKYAMALHRSKAPDQNQERHENAIEPTSQKVESELAALATLNWDVYKSASDLESLGLEKLKQLLRDCKLKCGGSLAERAIRLFSVRGKRYEDIDARLKSK